MAYSQIVRAVVLCLMVIALSHLSDGVELKPVEKNIFDHYKNDVYVVDMRKHLPKPNPFTLRCLSEPDALDLRMTFTGLDSKVQTVSPRIISLARSMLSSLIIS